MIQVQVILHILVKFINFLLVVSRVNSFLRNNLELLKNIVSIQKVSYRIWKMSNILKISVEMIVN